MSVIFTNPIDDIAEAIANGTLKEHVAITTRLMVWVADELDDRADEDRIRRIADLAAWAMTMQHRADMHMVLEHDKVLVALEAKGKVRSAIDANGERRWWAVSDQTTS